MPEEANIEEVLERFEQAWQSGTPPVLANFWARTVPADKKLTDRNRWELLVELIKIDLEYRWRRRSSAGQLAEVLPLEAYLAGYPELRRAGPLLVYVIGEEYRGRHRWGDRPGHGEYATRFADCWQLLQECLVRIDGELRVEFTHERRRVPSLNKPVDSAIALRSRSMNQVVTPSSFLETLQQYHLLDPERTGHAALAELPHRVAEPRALARELLQRGWLTPYQVNQVFLGRAADLWLPPYVLIERLGEGGMGQVFKARHADMRRVVALKLIRKELLVDAEAISRFRREVQVISTLTHPNIVHAYDADLTGPVPYLVMEYVEGIALGRLVKDQGALPVEQACDYIRQAAQGLQHIHERGLVHRDLKPANLMVTGPNPAGKDRPGLLKIMDLGLARLMNPVHRGVGDAPTVSGAVMMGTLDYMAPEQALDFRQADIRADIYSLGCTFYFLLTGQPPFPEGTTAQKLLMHQLKDPPPLERLRPDLPATLPPLVVRMIAKQPRDRVQTPGEVARLLDPFVRARPMSDALVPVAARNALVARAAEVIVINARPFQRSLDRLQGWLQNRTPRQQRRLVLAAGIVALGLFAWFLAWAFWKPEVVFLSDLPEKVVGVNSDLGFGKNGRMPGGGAISVKGHVSSKGLGTPPGDRGIAVVRYSLNKEFRQFQATVSLHDSNPECPTALLFAVKVDGDVKWESKLVKKQSDEQEVSVSVAGADVLELTVSCPGPARVGVKWATFPVWLEPRLSK